MTNGKESQVGGEVSTTITGNNFKKNSPVPYFRWYYFYLRSTLPFNRQPGRVKGGRGWQQEVGEVRCAGQSTKTILKRTHLFLLPIPSFSLFWALYPKHRRYFQRMPFNRRPGMVKGGRGWQQEVRGDGPG